MSSDLGLTSAEARSRLQTDGPNTLATAERRTVWGIALSVLREPMFVLLIAAALLYILLGDIHEALVLSASLVVVIAITVLQERRTERALESLRDLSAPRALVVRDGSETRIAGAEVVRGDLLILSEGDRIAADARVIAANDLYVDESLLTGESVAVPKGGAEEASLVCAGTLVVKGRGRALVTATGSATAFGRIGTLLQTQRQEKTALELETARIVKLFGGGALVFCIAVTLLHLSMRGDWIPSVLAGLTLAMAIVPEEFPVVLTIYLALGAWRIARHGVLTRRIPAIETLGSATVLCVDKTGTLTENRMAVLEVFADGAWHTAPWTVAVAPVLESAALACEIDPFDPMDRAILSAAEIAAPRARELRRTWRLEQDYPLSDSFLAVCHGWRAVDGASRVVVKGAPETVLALCRGNDVKREELSAEASRAAARGLRLLGVAEAQWSSGPFPDSPRGYDFRWIGFIALADPLRASVPPALEECRRAGIRVVMITGDYPVTALAIARQAGLDVEAGACTGDDLERMSPEELVRAARRIQVFARIKPEQKLKLVNAYKAIGEIVAMTGDGVNDAPALRAAHIGVAMGARGTDVAREAASLVLTQDDFGAIVAAVRLGRRVYQNIHSAMRYLISVHVPIAGMAVLPIAFGWPLLLFPVHVVFLEFAIDPSCSIVFEAEETEEDAMSRPPRDPRAPLFSSAMLATSVAVGVAMLAAVAGAYAWAVYAQLAEGQVRAVGFSAIVFANLFLIFATRSGDASIARTWRRPNRALWWIVIANIAAIAAVLYVPPVAALFRFEAIGPGPLVIALLAGATAVAAVEALKRMRRLHAA